MEHNARVYIVDDRDDYRFIAGQVFRQFLPQYTVRFFSDGSDLQQLILANTVTNRPGLILLDFHMPGLNGLQTLTYLKQEPEWCHVPVVLMSNSLSDEEMTACYEAGITSIIAKPTDLMQLRESFESTCRYWLETDQRPQDNADYEAGNR